jgi:protease-4
VIVYINSPGGTATGGEALFDALRGIAKSKPVVAQFGTVATSAAYMAGIAADHIVARGNTITGSVGVIWQWPEVTQLLEKLGVKMNAITSGPLKANPNPYQPLDAAGRQVVEQMIAESQKWFLGLVAGRRNLATASVPGLEAGRVYTGRDALGHKLIDAIGDEADAVAWLVTKKGVSKALKVVDWKPKRDMQLGPFRLALNAMVRLLGLGGGDIAAALADDPRVAALRLDGLVAIWLPFER